MAAMTLATLLWGATFVAIRDTLHAVAPVDLVFGRFVASTLAFGAMLALRPRALGRAALAGGALAGLGAGGCYLFQAIGLTATSAGTSAFLTCTGTVLAAFFAWPLLGQRPSGVLVQGIALALAGSALLSTAPLGGGPGGFRLGAGELWTLLGAALYALQIVAVARFAADADPLALAGIQSLTVALLLLPFAHQAPAAFAALDPASWRRFAYLAVAGTIVAPLLQVLAQRVLPAGRVALLFALEPVFALLFALTLGGERFGPRWWLGAALILGGVVRVEWRAARPSPAAPRPATR